MKNFIGLISTQFFLFFLQGDNIYYDVSVDMKGDIIAKIGCENKQQKLRVGDIHNKDNVTLVCDQPTKTWSIVSMSDKVNKNDNLILDLHCKQFKFFF